MGPWEITVRLLAITVLWLLTGHVLASMPSLPPFNASEATSFTLTCRVESSNTTEPSHIGIVQVTAPNIGVGPIIHWKSPSTSWVTLVLRPVDERTWASRVDLGTEEGTHRLQCLIVGAGGGGKITARTYQLAMPAMKLTETGIPEVWSQGPARSEIPAASATVPFEAEPPASGAPKGQFSSVLAGAIVFSINLAFLFGAGIGFVVHRRRKAHHDLADLHEMQQKFVEAGLMEAPVVPAVETPKVDVTEIVAAEAVVDAMNATVETAAKDVAAVGPTKNDSPEEGVDIRKSTEEEEKIDMNDLSF